MSYASIHACANDPAIQNRITACIAQEGGDDPNATMYGLIWQVVSATDVEQAYEDGGAEAVTDAMLLAKVQPLLP